MPYIVGYSTNKATNLFYSATIAVTTIVGEIRSLIGFLIFSIFNIQIGLLLTCKASLFFFIYYRYKDISTIGGGIVLRAIPTS